LYVQYTPTTKNQEWSCPGSSYKYTNQLFIGNFPEGLFRKVFLVNGRDKMKTAIMGFGNPVRSDDGIGMYVIERLQKIIGQNNGISIFDMGTAAFEVLFGLKGHNRIIMVDAVINSNEPVGTLFKVPAEEVLRAPQDDPLVFLHGMKWDQALSYAKKILGDDYPEDIQVYLIAVENTKLETEISNEVKLAGDKVVQHILEDVKLTNA
jgi:hydrogenase maturation protease